MFPGVPGVASFKSTVWDRSTMRSVLPGPYSSSVMVTVSGVVFTAKPLVAPLKVIVTVSSPSRRVSSKTSTLTIAPLCPLRIVTDPLNVK